MKCYKIHAIINLNNTKKTFQNLGCDYAFCLKGFL
jgi:hypothetical protein